MLGGAPLVALLLHLLLSVVAATGLIDHSKTLIWGAGLTNAHLQLPVRHFFLQLVDTEGNNVTTTPVGFELTLELSCDEAKRCRARRQVIDRHDGSFIVRFRFFESYSTILIQLSCCGDKPLGKGSFQLKGAQNIRHEECFCPQPYDDWLKRLNCKPDALSAIREDLKPWQDGSVNFSATLQHAKERWAIHRRSHSFCHYRIGDNRVRWVGHVVRREGAVRVELYRECYGEHVGFKMFADAALLSLLRKVRLSDTHLLLNLGDWPLEQRSRAASPPVPMLSWCGSDDSFDVVLPTYELMEATLEMLGRQSLDLHSVQEMRAPPWPDKIDKAFFRGRDSRQERLDLVLMARQRPDLLEAGITRFFFFRDVMHKYEPAVEQIPFGDFFKYRYQVNVDGTVAAYRLAYLLAGDALVLKQQSPYYEHYYRLIQPWVHYVPLHRNLSDVFEKVLWARANPAAVAKIIASAQSFVAENLEPSDLFCYHAMVLHEYSTKLQPQQSVDTSNMELVQQPHADAACCAPATDKHTEL